MIAWNWRLACFLIFVSLAAAMDFDCRRAGVECHVTGAHSCHKDTGKCVCNTDWAGDRCDRSTTADLTCADPAICKNGGTCGHDTTNTNLCFCTDDYKGATCEENPIDFECSATGMTINSITTRAGDNFGGKIFLEVNEAACTLQNPTSTSSVSVQYTVTGTPDADCKESLVEDIAATAGKRYLVSVIVQYMENVRTSLDRRITLKCEVVDGVSNTLPATNVPIDEASITTTYTESQSTASLEGGLTLEARKPDATDATIPGDLIDPTLPADAQKLGDPNFLRFKMEVKGYQFFIVTKLTGTNGDTAEPKAVLIDDGCLTEEGSSVVTDITLTEVTTTSPNTKTVDIKYRMFTIQGSKTLQLSADVLMCIDGSTCARSACPSKVNIGAAKNKLGFGELPTTRRRRSAVADGTQGTLDVSLRIRDIGADVDAIKRDLENAKDQDCFRNTVFLAPLILLAVLLFVSMTTTLFLCTKMIRVNRKEQDGIADTRYTA